MNQSNGIVAISTHARKIMEKIGVDPALIIDLPNGADTEKFHQKSEFDLRGHFGLPPNCSVVLSVGRESWAKAYDTGIRAFARVFSEVPEVFYVILGQGTRS